MYHQGYKIEVVNYGSQFKVTVTQQGKFCQEDFSSTHQGAITKAKRIIKVFVG